MRVPIPLQSVYAELLEQAAVQDINREFPAYGGFAAKTVKGRKYIYWRGQVEGVRREKLVGPDDPETWSKIGIAKLAKRSDENRERLVDALVNAGFPGIPAPAGKILRALSAAGVFRKGGLLVGTWAFLSYGPGLGAILPAGLGQTQDMDILQIEVATEEPESDLFQALLDADSTFRPSFSLLVNEKPAAFHNSAGYRVEFLTIKSRTAQWNTVAIKGMNIAALPLPYQEYLLTPSQHAVMLFAHGVLVRVPLPERYALHKLIVSQRRSGEATAVKAQKDIAQSDSILSILIDDSPLAVRRAWKDLLSRGPKWRSAALAGAKKLSAGNRAFLESAAKAKR